MTTNTLLMNVTIKNYTVCLSLLFLGLPFVSTAQSITTEPILPVLAVTEILNVSMLNIGACNNQGTKTKEDDTYTGLVTITFEEMPTGGVINISGTTAATFDFEGEEDGQSAFSFPLELPTDGEKVVLSIDYIGGAKSNFVYQSFRNSERGCALEIVAAN